MLLFLAKSIPPNFTQKLSPDSQSLPIPPPIKQVRWNKLLFKYYFHALKYYHAAIKSSSEKETVDITELGSKDNKLSQFSPSIDIVTAMRLVAD